MKKEIGDHDQRSGGEVGVGAVPSVDADLKHTELPWKVGRGPSGEVEVWGPMRLNATLILASMESQPREANAALIVRAVNSHADMLAALKNARSIVHAFCGDLTSATPEQLKSGVVDVVAHAVEMEIDTAIARAEGR